MTQPAAMMLRISLLVILGWIPLAARGQQSPNVVLMIADDQAWTDFGFMGHATVRTLHLDELAGQSRVFTRGYVPTSLCCPSLATLLCGLYPHQHGVTGNDPAPLDAAGQQLDADALAQRREAMIARLDSLPILPRLLAAHGYRCFQSGKWWLGDYRRGGFTHGMTHGDLRRGGRHGDEGLKIGRQGIQPVFDFIDQSRGKPFFVWFAPMLPHTPHNPPPELLSRYAVDPRPIALARYWAMCEWLDRTCGELADGLQQRGLRENTLIVFVVDNGWIQRTGSSDVPDDWPADFEPRSKQSPYEGGVRTPILLNWPGRIDPVRIDSPVSSVDIFPTILDACGIEIPEELPGKSLLDRDDRRWQASESVFGEVFAHDIADLEDPAASLLYRWCVHGRWKLIVTDSGRPGRYGPIHPQTRDDVELYDVVADPFETSNLAAGQPELTTQLVTAVDHWWPGR